MTDASRRSKHELAGHYSYLLLRFAFFLGMALFPFGKAFQVCTGAISLVALVLYYGTSYKDSTLAKLPARRVIFLFLAFILFNTLTSGWLAHSFDYLRPTLHESWPLLFAGIEVIRSEKDIRLFGFCCLIVAFGEGLAGVWQYATGGAPFTGKPLLAGRLTGTMNTYRVGNYIAMVIPPACIGYFLFHKSWSRIGKISLLALLIAPALFLLVGSQTRSGMLGLFVCAYLAGFLLLRPGRLYLIAPPALFTALVLFGPERISLHRALQDPRWELWSSALSVFTEHPIIGAGASTFRPATEALGAIAPHSHPHNIYVQFLADGGIVGFSIALLFLVGLWGWSGLKVLRNTKKECSALPEYKQWQMTALLWAGYTCYLTTGIFGHNFYRSWWLATGMALLGVTLAACQLSSATPKKQPQA